MVKYWSDVFKKKPKQLNKQTNEKTGFDLSTSFCCLYEELKESFYIKLNATNQFMLDSTLEPKMQYNSQLQILYEYDLTK